MNKGVLIGIAALVIVGLAAGGYMMLSGSEDSTTTDQTTDTMMDEGEGQNFSGTFLDLLALGQDYTCTISSADDQGNITSGQVYIASSGDRMNGQFTFTQEGGKVIESSIIRDGEYNYIWSSESGQGFKTKIDPEDESVFGSSEESEENVGGFNDQDEVDFNCEPWSVDTSIFNPPSDIEFVDLSESMQKMQELNKGTQNAMEENEIDCSVCDQVPEGEAKEQCLSGLGC